MVLSLEGSRLMLLLGMMACSLKTCFRGQFNLDLSTFVAPKVSV